MDYSYSEEKIKQFKPLILFHNNDNDRSKDLTSQLSVDDENHRNLIEQHRLKTIDMMEHNAHIWENGGYITTSNSYPPEDHRLSVNKSNHLASIDGDLQIRKRRYSHAGILKIQTQTSIPQPLYHKHSTSKTQPILISEFQNNTSKGFDNESMTFIAEPQFHHSYKPQLNRKRRRGNLPKKVTEFLKQWLILHKKHPYPTEREKQNLADETGLMVSQISNWFINARRRILQPLLESESQQASSSHHQENTAIPHNLYNTPNGEHILTSINDNKQDSDYYYYDSDQLENSNETRSPEATQDNNKEKNKVPPPWVLLPEKLPSMNILEKDLGAFKPEE